MLKLLKKHLSLSLFSISFLFALVSAFLIFQISQGMNFDKHLVLLAERFIHWKIALLPDQYLPLGDIADYYSNFYIFYGPLPSIILMPFAAIWGKDFPQAYLGVGSMVASFAAVYFLSKSFKFNATDSLWLSLFFVFSTVLYAAGLINITAYQVQVLGVPLVLFALLCYFRKKHPLLIGLFIGLALLTRAVLVLSLLFFVLEFFQKRLTRKQLAMIFVPVLLCGVMFGLYNQRRFHSFFNTGYRYAISLNNYPISHNLDFGYTSLRHIPANLYSFLIMPPEPVREDTHGFVLKFPYLKANPWGMAIWFTSPLFLLLVFRFKKSKYTMSSLVTAGCLLAPLLVYFSIGFAQYGYRYALDFLPFLFLLLLPTFNGKLTKLAIILIIIGVIFNSIYITSLWGIYPHFGIHL